MKKVIITGANGQLGSEMQVLSKYDEYHDFNFFFSDIDTLNILDKEKVFQYFDVIKPDFLINCAAYTAVDKAETEFGLAMKVNGTAVEILAEACATFKTSFIHISTDYVFDGNSCTPYQENDNTNPQSAYGKSKLAGEQALFHSDADFIIIRTSWLYSSFGSNFVKTILKAGKERGRLNVIFDQIGTPTYAYDLAQTILLILHKKQKSDKSEKTIYNFANEGVCSWYDFAVEIIKLGKINCSISPIETKDYPLPAKRPFYSVFNKSKIKNDFNFSINHWRDSLEICFQKLDY